MSSEDAAEIKKLKLLALIGYRTTEETMFFVMDPRTTDIDEILANDKDLSRRDLAALQTPGGVFDLLAEAGIIENISQVSYQDYTPAVHVVYVSNVRVDAACKRNGLVVKYEDDSGKMTLVPIRGTGEQRDHDLVRKFKSGGPAAG